MDLARDLVAVVPSGLAVLLGFGAALLVARKSLAAAAFFGLGLLAIAFELLLEVVVPTALIWAGRTGPVAFTIYGFVASLARGLGVLMVLVGACLGPAPKRDEEDF